MNAKNKEIVKLILKTMQDMDPSGANTKRYKDIFDKMEDRDMDKFIADLKTKKQQLYIEFPNIKNNSNIDNLFDAARNLGVDCFDQIKIFDDTTQRWYITPHRYMILRLPVRRLRQYVKSKRSLPVSDKTIDYLSGQVTKPNQAASLSQPEIQAIHSRGLSASLVELIKVRGGDVNAYQQAKHDIAETGRLQLGNLPSNTRVRSVAVMSQYLKAAFVDNTYINKVNVLEEFPTWKDKEK